MSQTRSALRPAPATERTLVLCAHGSRGLAGAVSAHAAALAGEGDAGEVRACALYGEPRLESVLADTDGVPLTLIPFMMAEGYTLDVMRERVSAAGADARVQIAQPVGAHPKMVALLRDKAESACRDHGWDPAETALLVVGHGTQRHAASGRTARRHADSIAQAAVFAEVATAFLDEPPEVPDAVAALTAPQCVAVGFFADAGDHGREDVPALLAQADRPSLYAGPVGPDPRVRALIRAQAGLAPRMEVI